MPLVDLLLNVITLGEQPAIRRSLESIEREEQRLIRARDWAGVVDKQPDLDT